jgi:hypothetical protein
MEWSSDASNPVGAEFIIMEKVSGVPLVEKWDTMSTLDRYKVIDQVVQLENDLSNMVLRFDSIRFPQNLIQTDDPA